MSIVEDDDAVREIEKSTGFDTLLCGMNDAQRQDNFHKSDEYMMSYFSDGTFHYGQRCHLYWRIDSYVDFFGEIVKASEVSILSPSSVFGSILREYFLVYRVLQRDHHIYQASLDQQADD